MKQQSRTVRHRHQSAAPEQRHLPLVDILVDTQAELQELVGASGLKMLEAVLENVRAANIFTAEGFTGSLPHAKGAAGPVATSRSWCVHHARVPNRHRRDRRNLRSASKSLFTSDLLPE